MVVFEKFAGYEEFKIHDYDYVKCKLIKNNYELMANRNYKKSRIFMKKLDKDRYVYIPTGEVKKSNHIKSRQQDLNFVIVSVRKIRELLNHNFQGRKNEKCITLTYKDIDGIKMKDVKKLYKDVEKFVKNMRYTFQEFGRIEYMNVIQPMGRGSWHCHIAMKWVDVEDIGFIENDELIYKMWGHGWTKTKAINGSSLGNYLSAYLTNLELDEDNIQTLIDNGVDKKDMIIIDKIVDGKIVKFIKGGRLYLYPPGTNMYRKSKGILYPPEDEGGKKEVMKRNGFENIEPSKIYKTIISNDAGKVLNVITKEKYHMFI